MEELKIEGNNALTESIYQTSFNGDALKITFGAMSINPEKIKEHTINGGMTKEMMMEMKPASEVYHVAYPNEKSKHLFDQPIDAEDNKIPVYDLGIKEEKKGCCCGMNIEKDEIRRVTSRKIVAHGAIWLYAAIALGMDKKGTTTPIMVSQAVGSFGGDKTNESQMIGYVDEKLHNMCALIVRRAKLYEMNLASISIGYKYIFVEPEEIGKAKVKEG